MNGDPISKLRIILGYAVAGVWVISFLGILVIPEDNSNPAALLYVNAAMMVVLGGLYASFARKRNGNGNGNGNS